MVVTEQTRKFEILEIGIWKNRRNKNQASEYLEPQCRNPVLKLSHTDLNEYVHTLCDGDVQKSNQFLNALLTS